MKNPINNQLNGAQLSMDLNALSKLKQRARQDDPEALKTVARQFEALFLNMLMKNMRQANNLIGGENNPFNSSDVQFYQGMLDQELGLRMAGGQGIGLADVLVRQLSRGPTLDPTALTDLPRAGADLPQAASEKPELEPGTAAKDMLALEQRRRFDQALESTARMAVDALLSRSQASQTGATDKASAASPLSAQAEGGVRPAQATPAASESGPSAEVVKPVEQPGRFENPEAFVSYLYPVAEQVAGRLGVDPRVLVAQAALETGWGRHVIQRSDGTSTHNLFNIKADSRWDGAQAVVGTLEYRDGVARREQAAFRAYDSYEQSFNDYIAFLQNSPRYEQALSQSQDARRYLEELQQAGYATDPRYADKISAILDGEMLNLAVAQIKDNQG